MLFLPCKCIKISQAYKKKTKNWENKKLKYTSNWLYTAERSKKKIGQNVRNYEESIRPYKQNVKQLHAFFINKFRYKISIKWGIWRTHSFIISFRVWYVIEQFYLGQHDCIIDLFVYFLYLFIFVYLRRPKLNLRHNLTWQGISSLGVPV